QREVAEDDPVGQHQQVEQGQVDDVPRRREVLDAEEARGDDRYQRALIFRAPGRSRRDGVDDSERYGAPPSTSRAAGRGVRWPGTCIASRTARIDSWAASRR